MRARITQLSRDMDRETGLNRDAGDTIARLDWEAEQLARAHDDELRRVRQRVDDIDQRYTRAI